jgi:predicted nucleic acid-binding Zn ribbon protein
MPVYLYANANTGEVKEVFQGMNDPHVYEENGVQWERIYTVPQATFDTKVDPFSSKDFVKKTQGKGTVGDLMDRAKEWQQDRADKVGADDPIVKKADEEWSKTRGGRRLPKRMEDVVIDAKLKR